MTSTSESELNLDSDYEEAEKNNDKESQKENNAKSHNEDRKWQHILRSILERISSIKVFMEEEIKEIDIEIDLFDKILIPFISEYDEYDKKIREFDERYLHLNVGKRKGNG